MKHSNKRIVEKLLKEDNIEYFVVTCTTNGKQSNVDLATIESSGKIGFVDVYDDFTGGEQEASEFYHNSGPNFMTIGADEEEQQDQMAFGQWIGFFITDDHAAATRVENNWRASVGSVKNKDDFKKLLANAR